MANAYPADARCARFLLCSLARHHLYGARSGPRLERDCGRCCQAEVYLFGVFYFCATDSVGCDVDKFRPQTPRLRPVEAAPSPRLCGTGARGPSFHIEGQTRRKRATRLWARAWGAADRAIGRIHACPQTSSYARDMNSRSHFNIKSIIVPAILSVIAGLCGRIPLVSAQEVAMPDSNSRNGEVLTQVLKKCAAARRSPRANFRISLRRRMTARPLVLRSERKYLTSHLWIRTVTKESFAISPAPPDFFWSLVEAPIGDPTAEASSSSWSSRAGASNSGE